MSRRIFSSACFIVATCLFASLCSATVAPVTRVTTDNPAGSPPYNLTSVIVGSYTVNVSELVSGTSTTTLDPVNGVALTVLDDLEIGTQYSNSEPGDSYTVYMFGGKLWTNANGDEPDFFIFEAGGQDNPVIAPILPGGVIGQGVTIPASDGLWGNIGNGYTAPSNGQQIFGVSFAITDLRDASGVPLTNSSIIEGLAVTSRAGLDPSDWFAVASAPILTAMGPSPEDGALYPDTWANLSWSAGDTAASHDLYISDSFDDVNDRAAAAFQGNQPSAFVVVGFLGFPLPDGLVPGTTYYWVVDEVEADGTTKHRGTVWSFTIPSKTAFNPIPVDGAMFVAPDTNLNWTTGFGAKLHTVYFGETFDEVDVATAGQPVGTATFSPGTLELEKTYYWRVDEFDGITTHKGDIWSFTVTSPGLGTAVMDRWENITTTDLSALKSDTRFPNNPDVTETINEFKWDGPDTDDYGARIQAWLYVPTTGDYTFWLATDDQGELWLSTDDDSSNVELIANISGYSGVNEWTKFTSQKSAPIPLIGGERYYIAAFWKEGGGGDHCNVAWEGPGIPTLTTIPGSNLSPFEPMSAYGAKPANRSIDVTQTPVLQWKSGLQAASHEVYFGTDAAAVASATKASPEYVGSRQLGSESYEPAMLTWDTTYYWRVDEINTTNPAGPWVGKVWNFTTADYGIVEDFEIYNDIESGQPGSKLVYETWVDGYGVATNGSTMGYATPFQPTMEFVTVHGGLQSAPMAYSNVGIAMSEVTRTFAAQNWNANGATVFSLWFFGEPANSPGQLYAKINGVQINYPGAAANLGLPIWQRWDIDLASVGTNLQSVTSLAVGVQGMGATGTLLLDDISLYRAAPALPVAIFLEAEAAVGITPPMKTYTDPLASGGQYIGTDDGIGDENDNPPADGVASYNFTVEAGTYKIELRARPDAGNSVWVRIPGATGYSPGVHPSGWIRFNDIEAGADWHWDEVHSSDHGNEVVLITLPAGAHTLEIARREDGSFVDAILITNDLE